MGARIVLIARDKSRGEATLARLHESAPGLGHVVHYADLARIPEMKRVAAEIAHKEPRIDVLINNAGAMFSSLRLTEDDRLPAPPLRRIFPAARCLRKLFAKRWTKLKSSEHPSFFPGD